MALNGSLGARFEVLTVVMMKFLEYGAVYNLPLSLNRNEKWSSKPLLKFSNYLPLYHDVICQMTLTFVCSYSTHSVPFHHSFRHDFKIPKSDYPWPKLLLLLFVSKVRKRMKKEGTNKKKNSEREVSAGSIVSYLLIAKPRNFPVKQASEQKSTKEKSNFIFMQSQNEN